MPTLPTNRTSANTVAEHVDDHNALHAFYNAQSGSSALTANRQTGSYTLVLGGDGKVVEMNVGSANNLTVPPNTDVAFPTGTVIEIMQYGAGQTTIVAGAGVTLRSPSGLKITTQYGAASLRKIATNEWAVEGRLGA